MISIFATNPVHDARIPQMFIADPATLGPIDDQIERAIIHLRKQPAGSRSLWARYVVGTDTFDRAQVIRAGGWPNMPAMREKWTRFFTRIRAADLQLDLIFLDEETNLSPFQEDTAVAFAGMDPRRAGAICNAIVCQMIQELIRDTYHAVYSAVPAIIRYGDFEGVCPLVDGNDFPAGFGSVQGRSMPDLYNWYGPRHSKRGTLDELDSQWRAFLDDLDRLGNCVRPLPVVSPMSYWGDGKTDPPPKALEYLWREKLQHCGAAGVKRLVYWNAAATAVDDWALLDAIGRTIVTTPARPLGRVSMDQKSVSTGRVSTSYQAFRRAA